MVIGGLNANTITINPVNASDAGYYQVEVTGANGRVTNSAFLTLLNPTNLSAQVSNGQLALSWPAAYAGWRLQSQPCSPGAGLGTNWSDMAGSEATNVWIIPVDGTLQGAFFRLIYR